MDYAELYARLGRLLESSRVGVLTTVSADGYPYSRWMTPVELPGRSGFLYAVTAPDSLKAAHIRDRPKIEWFFQSKTLDEVTSVRGEAFIVDEPQAKAEVLEAIGPRLQIFWRVNPNAGNLVVLETPVDELSCFFPMRNERHRAVRG